MKTSALDPALAALVKIIAAEAVREYLEQNRLPVPIDAENNASDVQMPTDGGTQ